MGTGGSVYPLYFFFIILQNLFLCKSHTTTEARFPSTFTKNPSTFPHLSSTTDVFCPTGGVFSPIRGFMSLLLPSTECHLSKMPSASFSHLQPSLPLQTNNLAFTTTPRCATICVYKRGGTTAPPSLKKHNQGGYTYEKLDFSRTVP